MLAEILARIVMSMRHDEASERAADALGPSRWRALA
jgi:hypothetical protein